MGKCFAVDHNSTCSSLSVASPYKFRGKFQRQTRLRVASFSEANELMKLCMPSARASAAELTRDFEMSDLGAASLRSLQNLSAEKIRKRRNPVSLTCVGLALHKRNGFSGGVLGERRFEIFARSNVSTFTLSARGSSERGEAAVASKRSVLIPLVA